MQQRVATLLDDICVPPLTLIKFAIEEQTSHAENAIHGRSDLVAHIRKEFRLRSVCSFGICLTLS